MTEPDVPPGVLPRQGKEVHLVRWLRDDDGAWKHETILVTYRSATDTEWFVEHRGDRLVLERGEWVVFSP